MTRAVKPPDSTREAAPTRAKENFCSAPEALPVAHLYHAQFYWTLPTSGMRTEASLPRDIQQIALATVPLREATGARYNLCHLRNEQLTIPPVIRVVAERFSLGPKSDRGQVRLVGR